MARSDLLESISLALVASMLFFSSVAAFTPLVDKRFSYPDGIPYQVDTDNLERGTQTGYNRCNSTTEGQSSLCQTSFINSLDDMSHPSTHFCLWAPINANSIVGNVEGEMVAWCTKPGRGTRIIPGGALRGVQFMRTPDYVQVVGFIDQAKINIQSGDPGGEMDPHGADLRGNPLGGLVYSNAYTGSFKQVIEWHNFMGSDIFCFKACDPAGPNAARFCEHVYDRIGCAYNALNNAQSGAFVSCQGDNQDFPGVYVQNGVTQTYQQPPESLGPITSIPYTPRVPASSSCTQFASESIYAAGATVSASEPTSSTSSGSSSSSESSSGSTSATSVSGAMSASGTTSDSGTTSQTSSGTVGPTNTSPTGSTPTAGTQTPTGTAPPAGQASNAASTLVVSGVATIFGVVFAGLFLA
ncbi:hypothetical protein Hypma_009958 [Hypsizygus marmoreus]|uniref:Mannoprotein n=1 Tax=Hypsizygus marmoreus TaxID=39966 RepID=A0A369JRC0_HYPMA|nr:hypothetical protein Hypma_009958 [Hypsizygus marmoreus]